MEAPPPFKCLEKTSQTPPHSYSSVAKLVTGFLGGSSCTGCTLAVCSALVLAGFSFSLPVIAQTQEMKGAREDIHVRRQRRSFLLQPPDKCG